MTSKELKAAVLKKGWAGRTLSRAETADRINPIVQRHVMLNHAWASVEPLLEAGSDRSRRWSELMRTARLDVGKLMETVFSCGAVAYNGTDTEPADHAVTGWGALREQEAAFEHLLVEEHAIEHQIRTEAVLTRVLASSRKRLEFVRGCMRHRT